MNADLSTLSPEELERLWARLEAQAASRTADPELFDQLERSIAEAEREGRLDPERAAEIRADMRRSAPRAVLGSYWRDVITDRPAVGAFPRNLPAAMSVEEWYRSHPEHIANLMWEMGRFGADEDRVLAATAAFADKVGIADAVAEPVMVQGLARLRSSWRRAASAS